MSYIIQIRLMGRVVGYVYRKKWERPMKRGQQWDDQGYAERVARAYHEQYPGVTFDVIPYVEKETEEVYRPGTIKQRGLL